MEEIKLDSYRWKAINDQYTIEEYEKEMELYRTGSIPFASQNDFKDPLYNAKFAYLLPPLDAYRLVSNEKDQGGNMKENPNKRKVFSGWDNITNFEIQKMAEVKQNLIQKNVEIPDHFTKYD